MCCFSGPIDVVRNTNIFARASKRGRQYLVYSMTVATTSDVAMILPIPVPKRSPDDAVKFINLEEYPDFFDALRLGFPVPQPPSPSRSETDDPAPTAAVPLPVVEVGSYEASFVPSIKDFSRLDARFRLPEDVWVELPAYKSYGFAVFKLKSKDSEQTIHPMAFEFPRAFPERLFFPTVHIHDGEVHPEADFDHALFCQSSDGPELMSQDWRESDRPAGMFMDAAKTQGIVAPDEHCFLKELRGQHKNDDILV